MSLDVDALRARFPALAAGLVHLDGPGGSQVPDDVARAVARAMTTSVSARGTLTAAARFSDSVVVGARQAVADLLGTAADGVVFGRSTTDLTFAMARALSRDWGPGDEVVVSRLDHGANITPWVTAAERSGATLRWVEFDPETTEIGVADVTRVLSERTRLVAITAASNLVGTRPPVAAIADAVHEAGALLYLDGVHLAPHAPVRLDELGSPDFFACSFYKFFGPHCAAVAASPELLDRLRPDKLPATSDRVPERFELGTAPYELLAGVSATVDFLAGLSAPDVGDRRARVLHTMTSVEQHEERLRSRLDAGLDRVPHLVRYSRAERRTPTLLFTIDGREPSEVSRFLAERQVSAPAGCFNAEEAARALGLGSEGGVRVGLAAYTTDEEVDRLLDAMTDYAEGPP